MFHRAHSGVVVVVAVLAACSQAKEPGKSKPHRLYETFNYQVAVYGPDMHTSTFELKIDGKSLGSTGPNKAYVGVDYDSEKPLSGSTTLTARLDTTCGSVEVPLQQRFADPEDAKKIRGDGRSSTYEILEAKGTATMKLWVDNVGGKATTIEVGQHKIDVPADDAWVGYVRTGPCGTAGDVKIGGVDAGKLSPPQDEKTLISVAFVMVPKVQSVLVDAQGGHCYRQHDVVYADQNVQVDRKQDRVFKKGRVYAVDDVTDFLRSAPHKMTVRAEDDGGAVANVRLRTQLDRCR